MDSNDRLYTVEVNRSPTRIYPPEYLHPGMEFPPDEYGWSETIREAISRVDLTKVKYVLLHKRGYNPISPPEAKDFNKLTIVKVV